MFLPAGSLLDSFCLGVFYFEAGSHCEALAAVLAFDSERYTCLCLSSAGSKGLYHFAQSLFVVFCWITFIEYFGSEVVFVAAT